MPHIIAYARASHAEYRVGIEKLVPFREHMGDERVEPIFLDFEMDVGGPRRAAVRGREHFSNSAVGRDWIAFGEDRFEAEATIVVRAKGGAQPGLVDRPMLVLDIVKAIGVGVPCVDFSPGDRMAVRYDLSGDIERFARHRSEEHTSELQSLMRISYAVFCLKKKTNINNLQITNERHNYSI